MNGRSKNLKERRVFDHFVLTFSTELILKISVYFSEIYSWVSFLSFFFQVKWDLDVFFQTIIKIRLGKAGLG
jgi:hypothetical protein